jgi:hypothetical protein
MQSPRSEELAKANQHVQGTEDDDYADHDYAENEEPDDEVAAPAASPVMNIITSPRNDVQRFAHDGLVTFSTSHVDFIQVI